MHIELINTGSELILGFTTNTHLNYIARALAGIGLRLHRQTTVADDRLAIRAAISEALQRSDIVLVTGGLGPTSDDVTRDVAAELLGRKLIRDETIVAAITERVRRRGIRLRDAVLIQADVPEGATVLPNHNGTAPGLLLVVPLFHDPRRTEPTPDPSKEGNYGFGLPSTGGAGGGFLSTTQKLLFLLPGPPRELIPMFEESVLPRLPRGDTFHCRVFKVVGLPESLVEEKVAPVAGNVELGYCARPGEVEVRIIGPGVADAEPRIRAALGDHIYGAGNDRLEDVVIRQLTSARQTLAIAESCTGGLIAHRLTNVPGASAVFLNGWVTYSNEAKIRDIGVKTATLKTHGAVSEEVAREMAEGARQRSGADIAVATTGIAGPTGGTPEKPVGLVYIAVATPHSTTAQRHQLSFDRETFKFFASQTALDMVRQELLTAAVKTP